MEKPKSSPKKEKKCTEAKVRERKNQRVKSKQ